MRPWRPDMPFAYPLSSTQLVVCWALPRSHGAPITGFALETRRSLKSKHPDESDTEPDEPAPPTPFNGPMGACLVYKPPKSPWKRVAVPDYVRNASRVQEPLVRADLARGRDIPLVGSEKMSTRHMKLLYANLAPGRRWAYAVVGGFKPTSRHVFRVQSQNMFGASKFSASSVEATLLCDVPVKPTWPYPAASSFNAIILYWVEPCHNGLDTTDYQLQRRRVYTSGPEDSESEAEANDTTEWTDCDTVPVGDALGSQIMTGVPSDLVAVLALRGKRRYGNRCSYCLSNLRAGKTYQFRMRALNPLGWSAWSDTSIPCRTIGACLSTPCSPALCDTRAYREFASQQVPGPFLLVFHVHDLRKCCGVLRCLQHASPVRHRRQWWCHTCPAC